MAGEQNSENETVFSYDYRERGDPAEKNAEPADCPACRGKGMVLLLISSKPCAACGGTGETRPAASAGSPLACSRQVDSTPGKPSGLLVAKEGSVPGHWVTSCTYDRMGRQVSHAERFVPHEPASP